MSDSSSNQQNITTDRARQTAQQEEYASLRSLSTLTPRHSVIEPRQAPAAASLSATELSRQSQQAEDIAGRTLAGRTLAGQTFLTAQNGKQKHRLPNSPASQLSTLSPQQFPQPIARRFAQRFQAIRKLGQGGMGVVWLCQDTQNADQKVAVKFLPQELCRDAEAIRQFQENFQKIVTLKNPHIADVKELLFDEKSQQYFIYMDYIDGMDVQDKYLGSNPQEKFNLKKSLGWLREVAAGLDSAYNTGLVHKDIKPSNIRLNGEGHAFILDFGLASEARRLHDDQTLSHFHGGTPPYMSPEQWRNEPLDGRADQYSLAVMVYQLLSGCLPFPYSPSQQSLEEFRKTVLTAEVPPLPHQPKCVNVALQRALSKSRDARYDSATDFIEALDEGKRQRHRHALLLGTILLLVLGALAYGFHYFQQRKERLARQCEEFRVKFETDIPKLSDCSFETAVLKKHLPRFLNTIVLEFSVSNNLQKTKSALTQLENLWQQQNELFADACTARQEIERLCDFTFTPPELPPLLQQEQKFSQGISQLQANSESLQKQIDQARTDMTVWLGKKSDSEPTSMESLAADLSERQKILQNLTDNLAAITVNCKALAASEATVSQDIHASLQTLVKTEQQKTDVIRQKILSFPFLTENEADTWTKERRQLEEEYQAIVSKFTPDATNTTLLQLLDQFRTLTPLYTDLLAKIQEVDAQMRDKLCQVNLEQLENFRQEIVEAQKNWKFPAQCPISDLDSTSKSLLESVAVISIPTSQDSDIIVKLGKVNIQLMELHKKFQANEDRGAQRQIDWQNYQQQLQLLPSMWEQKSYPAEHCQEWDRLYASFQAIRGTPPQTPSQLADYLQQLEAIQTFLQAMPDRLPGICDQKKAEAVHTKENLLHLQSLLPADWANLTDSTRQQENAADEHLLTAENHRQEDKLERAVEQFAAATAQYRQATLQLLQGCWNNARQSVQLARESQDWKRCTTEALKRQTPVSDISTWKTAETLLQNAEKQLDTRESLSAQSSDQQLENSLQQSLQIRISCETALDNLQQALTVILAIPEPQPEPQPPPPSSLSGPLCLTLSNGEKINLMPVTDFWISEKEITRAQYATIVMSAHREKYHERTDVYYQNEKLDAWPASNKNPNYPVSDIMWDEAVLWCQFCTFLATEKKLLPVGMTVRLPTRKEWLTACGDTVANLQTAWYRENGGKIRDVGTLQPNLHGLYDMLGNVAEWCLDAEETSTTIPAPHLKKGSSSNVRHPRTCRLCKGGSYASKAKQCSSSSDNYELEGGYYGTPVNNGDMPGTSGYTWKNGYANDEIGFRVVVAKPLW